jgi:hypothetical protein
MALNPRRHAKILATCESAVIPAGASWGLGIAILLVFRLQGGTP